MAHETGAPAAAQAESSGPGSPSAGTLQSPAGSVRRVRVLVVDDEPLVRETLRDLLLARDFEVVAVESGEAAYEHVGRVDVVLLDAMLPGDDGWTVCRRIKREYDPLLPIIMVTARTAPEDVVRTFEAGADDYVAKPFSVAELMARIASRLEVHRTEVALTEANRRLTELAEQNYTLYEQARRDVQERAHLLRELDHRVRNNLSVMLGLVSMERSRKPPRDTVEALQTLESRMRSFLLVHEALRRENYRGVPVRDFVGRLAQRLRNAHALEENITIDIDTPDVAVGERDGFALALILNELLTNTFRHAFPDRGPGRVDVRMTIDNGEAVLEVRDDGAGERPPDQTRSEPGSGRSIVNALAKSELNGTVEYEPGETGMVVRVRWPFESA
jgi:DNA-binding response OmpR family regulator